MRKREVHINVRTTQEEKNLYQKRAALCGLSLSEYFRKLASGYDPKPLPPIEYQRIISALSEVYGELKKHNTPDTAQKLLEFIIQIQAALFDDRKEARDGHN